MRSKDHYDREDRGFRSIDLDQKESSNVFYDREDLELTSIDLNKKGSSVIIDFRFLPCKDEIT